MCDLKGFKRRYLDKKGFKMKNYNTRNPSVSVFGVSDVLNVSKIVFQDVKVGTCKVYRFDEKVIFCSGAPLARDSSARYRKRAPPPTHP